MSENQPSAGIGGFPKVFWVANSVELLAPNPVTGLQESDSRWLIVPIIYGMVVRYLDKKIARKTPLETKLASETA